MSEKQLEQIKNSKISDYFFDEEHVSKKLFKGKTQTSEKVIQVAQDEESLLFYLDNDYVAQIYFENENNGDLSKPNPDDSVGHEVLFAQKGSTKRLTGNDPSFTSELFSQLKACIGYFIIYKHYQRMLFNFKASKDNQDAYRDFWKDKNVPSSVKKDMSKLETMYPEYYKQYQKMLKGLDVYSKIRFKAYTKTIRNIGGTILQSEEEKKHFTVVFSFSDAFYKEINKYYESI